MKKPKKPKTRQPQRMPQSAPQPPSQQQALKVTLGRILQSWWTRSLAVLAIFVALPSWFGAYDFVYGLYADPALTIHLSGADPNPFELPFLIKNEGRFTADELKPVCVIESMKDANNNTFTNMELTMRLPFKTIEPKQEKTASCGVKVSGVLILQAKVRFQVAYKTLGVSRKPAQRNFTWYADASPPRWVESD